MSKQQMLVVFSCAFAALCAGDVFGQQNRGQPRQVAGNLDNPTGIAVHPESGDLFVAQRSGIVRLYKEEGQNRLKRGREVARFGGDQYGKGPIYDIGPLGLAFLDNEHLVVGDGSKPDTEEVIYVFKIGATPPEMPAGAKSAAFTLGPLGSSEELKAEGNYYGVVVTGGSIYATANGDDTKGWIVRSKVTNGTPGPLERFIATKEAVEVDAPVAITVNSGGDLVVGQMGEINVPGDALLSIYDAESGELKANYETGLNDITGLAYSPDGKLYATDFSWMDTTQGGLFELTIDGDDVTARKVVELDKPTAIAFSGNAAYVTIFGTPEEGSERKPGKVMLIPRAALR